MNYEEVTADELKKPEGVQYEITGAPNAEDNGVVAPTGHREFTPEEIAKYTKLKGQMIRRAVAAENRKAENKRAQRARTAKSRKKRDIEKASRKKNR